MHTVKVETLQISLSPPKVRDRPFRCDTSYDANSALKSTVMEFIQLNRGVSWIIEMILAAVASQSNHCQQCTQFFFEIKISLLFFIKLVGVGVERSS